MAIDVHMIELSDGAEMPAIGQGTWYLGEGRSPRDEESEALRAGVEAGVMLVDTAEMYGDGEAERLVGEALLGTAGLAAPVPREDLTIVSKVYPWNAGRDRIFDACDASLERLGTDYLDLYLLHWRGNVPLRETVAWRSSSRRARSCAGASRTSTSTTWRSSGRCPWETTAS